MEACLKSNSNFIVDLVQPKREYSHYFYCRAWNQAASSNRLTIKVDSVITGDAKIMATECILIRQLCYVFLDLRDNQA